MSKQVLQSALFLAFTCSTALAGQDCQALAPARETALVQYVRKEYTLDNAVALKLAKNEIVAGTCYRELTFADAAKDASGGRADREPAALHPLPEHHSQSETPTAQQ